MTVPSDDFCVQCVESVLPLRPTLVQPGIELVKRFGAQAIYAPLRFPMDLHESRLAKDPEVAGDARSGYGEQLRQVAHRRWAACQSLKDSSAALV